MEKYNEIQLTKNKMNKATNKLRMKAKKKECDNKHSSAASLNYFLIKMFSGRILKTIYDFLI